MQRQEERSKRFSHCSYFAKNSNRFSLFTITALTRSHITSRLYAENTMCR